MKIVNLEKLKPAPERASKFQGADFGADTSFFVVTSPPGRGVNKHRHPYQETLIVLDGDIEMTVGEEVQIINSGNAVVVPPKTWHAFINKSDFNALMVTIHASPQIIQEDWKENLTPQTF
jgi:quercetin dioxygenase-like cupin family protein